MAFGPSIKAYQLQELKNKRIEKEYREACINSIIKDLRNNETSVWDNKDLSHTIYIQSIQESYDILRKIRVYIPHTRMLIYKDKRSQRMPWQGEINGITIYYYTDECYPQPPIEPLPQHTDITCCALL